MENREAIEVLRFNADFCDAELEDAINLAISALEKQEQDKWISCSERLPKNNGEYLVTEKFSNGFPPDVCILQFAKDLYKLDEHDFYNRKGEAGFCRYDQEFGYSEAKGVIAWREKPEPYRGEEEE